MTNEEMQEPANSQLAQLQTTADLINVPHLTSLSSSILILNPTCHLPNITLKKKNTAGSNSVDIILEFSCSNREYIRQIKQSVLMLTSST